MVSRAPLGLGVGEGEETEKTDPNLMIELSCNPRRHRSWADRMDENEDEILNYEREINFEDHDDEPRIDSVLVKMSEKTRTFLE